MIEINHDYVAVRFRDGHSRSRRAKVAAACALMPFSERQELPGERFTLLAVRHTAEPRHRRHARAIQALRAHPQVRRAGLVHKHRSTLCVGTDRIWLGMAPGARAAGVLRRLVARGARVVDAAAEREFLLQLPPAQDPVVVSERLRKLRTVEYAEPDFVLLGRARASARRPSARPTHQYAVGVVEADRAWRLADGQRHVVIAVLDAGLMATHEDLRDAVVAAHDATGGRSARRPKPWDAHGTECAGIAAGTHRTRRGVKGIGCGAGLMAVRIGSTPEREGNYLSKRSWIRAGVDWAWQHGASVLSMSFGGLPPSAAVARALERARTRGRGGKGCVLVAAAGNAIDPGEPVEYPACLPSVIAVAATDRHDQPKKTTRTSPWTSKSGPEIDLAAPGDGLYTSTIPDPQMDELALYSDDFSGTSAATPVVAGGAALVLSARPELTGDEVRQILVATADKIGSVPYVDGRNDQCGYGRLNLLRAVRMATGRSSRARATPATNGVSVL